MAISIITTELENVQTKMYTNARFMPTKLDR